MKREAHCASLFSLCTLFLKRGRSGESLRGDIGVGLCDVEAGFLSGKIGVGEIFGALRFAAEYGGGELHVSKVSYGEAVARVAGAGAGGFQVCVQGESEDYAYQEIEGCGGVYGGVRDGSAADGGGRKVGAGVVSVAAVFEMRCGSAAGIFVVGAARVEECV